MDDFVNPPTCAKKDSSAKVSKKGGGRIKGSVKMTVSKAHGAKKVSSPLIQPSATFVQFQ
jgi:hypothetical protein